MQEHDAHAEQRALAQIRGFIYGMMSRLAGTPPSLEGLGLVCSSEQLAMLAADNPALAHILDSARCCLADAATLETAREEYQRLFIGPHSLPAPLWESVYRDPEHILFGEATLAVRAFYARYNLTLPQRKSEPDDHIAYELEFMARLIELGLARLEQGDAQGWGEMNAAQLAFLREHLLLWAPQSFAIQLEQAATGLYTGLASLVVEYLPYDAKLLEDQQFETF